MHTQLQLIRERGNSLLVGFLMAGISALALLMIGGVVAPHPLLVLGASAFAQEDETQDFGPSGIVTTQGNSLLPIERFSADELVTDRVKVMITAYSSTVWQTDSTPFITASGAHVRDGIIASNALPFGTKVRIPEYFGEKIFVVEDRLHSRKGNYHIDVWFPTTQEAIEFGANISYIEVLEG